MRGRRTEEEEEEDTALREISQSHTRRTDGHILCDSTHMRSLEESHLQTQGIDGGVF